MLPTRHGGGDQFLHNKSDDYRRIVRRKLDAYHRRMRIGLVAKGLLQCIAAVNPNLVWRRFSPWLRTRCSQDCPSEFVVGTALSHHLPDFLAAAPSEPNWRKFLRRRLDLDQMQGARIAA